MADADHGHIVFPRLPDVGVDLLEELFRGTAPDRFGHVLAVPDRGVVEPFYGDRLAAPADVDADDLLLFEVIAVFLHARILEGVEDGAEATEVAVAGPGSV